MPSLVRKRFTRYEVTYGIADPNGADYARLDLFKGTTKVGQVILGSAVAPGSYAALVGQQVHLYFPLSHFGALHGILAEAKNLSLWLDTSVRRGGITNSAQPV